jgi:hypothetical protein
MNTYTCPDYLRDVWVEILLYLELQKKRQTVAVYRDKLLSEIFLFV